MKYAHLLFQLGNLQVYTLTGPEVTEFTPTAPVDNYYWRDPGSPQGYGPFTHVSTCIEHYKAHVTAARLSSERHKLSGGKTAAIIRLDFKSKKRVISDF